MTKRFNCVYSRNLNLKITFILIVSCAISSININCSISSPTTPALNKIVLRKVSLPTLTLTSSAQSEPKLPMRIRHKSLPDQLKSLGLKINAAKGIAIPDFPQPVNSAILSISNMQSVNTQPNAIWNELSLTLHPQTVFPDAVIMERGNVGLRIFNNQPNTTYMIDIACYNQMSTDGILHWQDSQNKLLTGQSPFPSKQNYNFVFALVAPSPGEYDVIVNSNRGWIFDSAQITAISSSMEITADQSQ